MSENEKSGQSGQLSMLIFLGGMTLAYYIALRPQLLKWGTREDEAQRSFSGDDIVIKPQIKMTHAIDIEAPLDVVWLWLAQIGRKGSGFYTFDRLNNHGVPSADVIRRDLPIVAVDMILDNGLKVLAVDTKANLTFGNFNLSMPFGSRYDVSYSYVLEEHSKRRTRLLSRYHLSSYGWQSTIYNAIAEPLHFAQSLMQLKNIKKRAESSQQQIILSKEKSNGNVGIAVES